jgi:ATP-dependent helicase HrpB
MGLSLPVLEIAGDIVRALSQGNRLVLTAPTGSGKTTQVPQILLNSGAIPGQVLVLQPRRLATRMVAQRVAQEMNSPLGQLVGYQTRHESRVSAATRIRFMTEGLFLRLLQSQPLLPGVGAVVLDEFHERSLAADMALGLTKTLQGKKRPDLKLMVMSATLDADAVAAFLQSPVLRAGGRLFPVDIKHLPRRSTLPVWDLAAESIRVAAESREAGDVLVFMPGVYEINRTIEAARRLVGEGSVALRPLHGSLTPQQQDAALAPAPPGVRKVVVATNVAETSITIDGVRWVVDSGLARVHRYDAKRSLDALHVEPISRASADQRAGRAGRTAPGVCLRLWTEADHKGRDAQTDPEVRRIDLAEAVLQLKSMGTTDPRSFPWLEPPEPRAIERAENLLAMLHAVDPAGRVTKTGAKMASFPAHPRLARMMLEAAERGCLGRAVLWAALISEPDVVTRADAADLLRFQPDDEPLSDLIVREKAFEAAARTDFDPRLCTHLHVHANTAREVARTANLFERLCERMGLPLRGRDLGEDLLKCLLVAFPDHLAVRIDSQKPYCAMVGRKRVVLDKQSVVREPGLLVALEVSEIGRGEQVETVLSLASRVDVKWLEELHPDRLSTRSVPIWNEQQSSVEQAEERVFDGLVIDRTVRPNASPDVAAGMFVDRIMNGDLKLEPWNDAVTQWITRTRCVARWYPERKLITYDDDDVRVILHEIVSGATRWNQVKDRPCFDAVKNALSWDDQRFVQQMAPESASLPSGRNMPIEYAADGPPRGRGRIQDFYGLTETPRVGAGRQKVTLEILAPNKRPLQITDDLAGFWQRLYPEIRSEMKRRYPKHDWR